ncbi:MAG: serine/threonine protein kinase, partial [Deltaproteobacteria bacterium]|nr:serine/threonine protein kinase [Deltaproteobacteria bacterium]
MDRVGNYIIERELGRGGMGTVFAARHAILGHHVALKILHAELSQREDVVHRFFNEARAAAAIDHPNIVRVHDVGIHDDAAFLVMDLLPGMSLAERLRTRGPLAVPAAIAIARQIATALAAAHAAGIIHRDLKPDNIFLVDDPHAPDGTHVVLLDFGVAKLTGALQSGDLRTKTGALLGTPYYMSPEQCDGEREIDLRSDLYSLGCMLFQMVSGKLPFEGGLGAVLGAHLHVPAPALRTVVATIPAAIEEIVAQLMAKHPDDRFASATALIGALDTWKPASSVAYTP